MRIMRRLLIALGIIVVIVIAGQLIIFSNGRPALPVVADGNLATTTASHSPSATSAAGLTPPPALTRTPVATPIADFIARVITRTNQYRQEHGCPALMPNAILQWTAQFHSQDMALNDFVGHDSSDGTKVWDRIKRAGYNYSLVAENAAWGQQTPEEVVDVWFNETPPNDLHRQNILNCKLRDIGVGYYYLANDPGKITAHTYWTQDFGTPLQP
jgi:uncharacterized protein YkwD